MSRPDPTPRATTALTQLRRARLTLAPLTGQDDYAGPFTDADVRALLHQDVLPRLRAAVDQFEHLYGDSPFDTARATFAINALALAIPALQAEADREAPDPDLGRWSGRTVVNAFEVVEASERALGDISHRWREGAA